MCCCIAYATVEERQAAMDLMDFLQSSYPHPLQLEWEDQADRYAFLELEVLTCGPIIWCRWFSKFAEAHAEQNVSYVRLPHGNDGTSLLVRARLLTNTIRRIIAACTYDLDVMLSIILVAAEAVTNGWNPNVMCQAIWAIANLRNLRKGTVWALVAARIFLQLGGLQSLMGFSTQPTLKLSACSSSSSAM